MANPVNHFEILAADGKALQSFYADLLGWEIDADNPMNYGIVEAGDDFGGGIGDSFDGGSLVTVYVRVGDVQASLDRAGELGGKTVMPPREIAGGMVTVAQFADPAGNVIGLTSGMPD